MEKIHPATEWFRTACSHDYNVAVLDYDSNLLEIHTPGVPHRMCQEVGKKRWMEFVHPDDVHGLMAAMMMPEDDVLEFRFFSPTHRKWMRTAMIKKHIDGLQFCVMERVPIESGKVPVGAIASLASALLFSLLALPDVYDQLDAATQTVNTLFT